MARCQKFDLQIRLFSSVQEVKKKQLIIDRHHAHSGGTKWRPEPQPIENKMGMVIGDNDYLQVFHLHVPQNDMCECDISKKPQKSTVLVQDVHHYAALQ